MAISCQKALLRELNFTKKAFEKANSLLLFVKVVTKQQPEVILFIFLVFGINDTFQFF